MIVSVFDISLDKLHKNIEVQLVDIPAVEFIRTISAASQFLLSVPNDAADDIDYIVTDSHHHFDSSGRRANDHCHQRCLRRLCTYKPVTLTYNNLFYISGLIRTSYIFDVFRFRYVAITILTRMLIECIMVYDELSNSHALKATLTQSWLTKIKTLIPDSLFGNIICHSVYQK